MNGHSVSLVMPCRNEAGHLAKLVKEIPDFFDEIICVSNSSTDTTEVIGRKLDNEISKFTFLVDNRTSDGIGYGYAHMTGLQAATSEYVVCADSDGTYPVEDAKKLIPQMIDQDIQFATCTRYPADDIPPFLKTGVTLLNIEILLLYGLKLRDSLSGMWIMKREVIPSLKLTEGDWNLSPQIKLNACKYLRSGFKEIKIKQNDRHGETKQDYFKTGLHHAIWIAKNRFSPPKVIQKPDQV